MMTSCHDNVKYKIKQYLNSIIYIDDEFSLDLVDKKNSTNSFNAKMVTTEFSAKNLENGVLEQAAGREDFSYIDNDFDNPIEVEIVESCDSTSSNSKLEELLELAQKHYKHIKLFPYKYVPSSDPEDIINFISDSYLTIIDWQLNNSKVTAVDVLKNILCNDEKIHLIVVFTSSKEEAKKDFMSHYDDMEFFTETSENSNYEYTLYGSSLIMLCNKSDFDIDGIIDVFSELIINNYGYFPVVFFDTILELNKNTGKLLKKFAHPFESLLILHNYSTGYKYEELSNVLTNLVTNHINDEIKIDNSIIETIYRAKISEISSFASEDNKILERRINTTIAALSNKWKKDKDNLNALKSIDINLLKSCFSDLSCEPSEWNDTLESMIPKILDNFVEQKVSQKISKLNISDSILEKSRDQVKQKLTSEFSKLYRKDCEKWIRNILPTFLSVLTNNSMKESLSDLINVLKLIRYSDPNLKSSLNHDKYWLDTDNDDVKFNKDINKKKLLNIFNKGDILIDELGNYYLCITPSCDTFRPDKVNYILTFICGEVKESIHDIQHIKTSEHITIIPNDEGNICSVKWKFYESKSIDLKNREDFDMITKCIRPYRLNDIYAQQIINKYIAYFSRVGVDELFIKNSPQIGKLFF